MRSLLNDRLFAHDDEPSLDDLRGAIIEMSIRGNLSDARPAPGSGVGKPPYDTRTAKPLARPENEVGPFPLPPTWQWVRLGSLVNPSRSISYGVIKLGDDDPSGLPVLRCSDVRYRNLDLRSVKRISSLVEEQYQRTRLMGGEVLINIRGTLGGCAVVPPELAGYNIAREVAMLDPNSLILPSYLLNIIASPYFERQVESQLRGIAYKGINLGSLSKILVPLPPTSVQAEIVDSVNGLIEALEGVRIGLRNLEDRRAQLLSALIDSIGPGPHSQDGDGGPPQGGSPKVEVTEKVRSFASRQTRPSKTAGASPRIWPTSQIEEALLVGAIVDAFFKEGGEPVGNFRVQKAVYFSRRRLGERDLDEQFLKKAAGPYNPALRYEGGIAKAKTLNFIREAKGRFGFGYITGSGAPQLYSQLEDRSDYRKIAQWIVGRLRFVDNEEWEVLATVDYATEALRKTGIVPDAKTVLAYIADESEWRPKISRLSLTAPKVRRAMIFAQALFSAG